MTNTPPARQPLTRERVVAAAIDGADRNGLAWVNMRNVAGSLGVVPMALYKHVANKDALITAMVDAVIDQFGHDIAGNGDETSWREAVLTELQQVRRVMRTHPWAAHAIRNQTVRTQSVLTHMERISAIFMDGGISADLTHHGMHALGNRIWGFNPELFDPTEPFGASTSSSEAPSPTSGVDAQLAAQFPSIVAIMQDAGQRRPNADSCDADFEFTFGVQLILDGIARLHEQGWDSSSSRLGDK